MLRAAAMGDYMRYRTSLAPALNELIILITARHWSQQFEWYVHQPMALKAGLAPHIVAALSKGHRPDAMSSDETIVYEFATELLRLQSVSDTALGRYLADHGCTNTWVKRRRGWQFPSLPFCRSQWLQRYPGTVWRDPDLTAWRFEG